MRIFFKNNKVLSSIKFSWGQRREYLKCIHVQHWWHWSRWSDGSDGGEEKRTQDRYLLDVSKLKELTLNGFYFPYWVRRKVISWGWGTGVRVHALESWNGVWNNCCEGWVEELTRQPCGSQVWPHCRPWP